MLINVNEKTHKIIVSDGIFKQSFNTVETQVIAALAAYIHRFGENNPVPFVLDTVKSSEHYIRFNTGYRILIPAGLSAELANRMVLFNSRWDYPMPEDIEADEE